MYSLFKVLYRKIVVRGYSVYLMLALLAIVSMSWVLLSSTMNSTTVVAATPPKPVILAATPSCPNPTGDDDGDGLLNGWETLGYDQDGDGTIDLNLPAMGADPKKRDIFVEIDWMEGCKGNPKSFKPSTLALDKVVTAFADAPVSGPTPDIKTGINLHLDYGQGGQFTGGQAIPCIPEITLETFSSIKNKFFDSSRSQIFHYSVWANEYNFESGTLGIAEFVGNDLLTSFGSKAGALYFNDKDQYVVASTFMHELGHNLGLRHGGIADNKPFKPNHLSVMNYLFLEGIIKGGEILSDFTDVSRGRVPSLDENALFEERGLYASPDIAKYETKWFCRGQFNDTNKSAGGPLSVTKPIDWNCDKKIAKTALSANIDGSPELSPYTILSNPGDEWGNLILKNPTGSGIPLGGMNGGIILSPQILISSNVEPTLEEGGVVIERLPQWFFQELKDRPRREAEDKRLYGVRDFSAKLQGREVYLSWKSPRLNRIFNTYSNEYEPVIYEIYRLEEGRHGREEIQIAETQDLYLWDRTAVPGKSYFYGIVSRTKAAEGFVSTLSGKSTRIDLAEPVRIPPLPFSYQKSQAPLPLRPLKSLLENPDFAKTFQLPAGFDPSCCPEGTVPCCGYLPDFILECSCGVCL